MSIQEIENNLDLALHRGVFRKRLSLFQGVALIVSGTIGAGMLGIPYAIAKVGMGVGVLYILGIGFLMMGLNILIGEVAVRAKAELQLSGLAEKYLGRGGKTVMTILVYTMMFGALTIYIIGEGQGLAALFGGSSFLWSLLFFSVGAVCVAVGMKTIKTVEFFLTIGLLSLVLILAVIGAPHIDVPHWQGGSVADILFPYGVLLFAFRGTAAIPEAHSLLRNREQTFRQAIIISGVIVTIVYLIFTAVVIGITGAGTTELATVGLGQKIPVAGVLGNVFAVLAMGTCFLMVALALRDSLRWDYKFPTWQATAIVLIAPLFLFVFGLRQFVAVIHILGGVFMSAEMLLLTLIYLRARRVGNERSKMPAREKVFLGVLFAAIFIGGGYSVVNLLR